MNVTFQVALDYEHWLNEFDLKNLTSKQSARLKSKQSLEGRLIVAHEEEATIEIDDVLEAWVQNLCFAAIPSMLFGQGHEILYFSRPGYLRLEPEGLSVRISGDLTPTAVFPVKLLAPALFLCGDRFLKWSREFKKGDVSYQGNLDCVEEYRQPAIDALRAADLPFPASVIK